MMAVLKVKGQAVGPGSRLRIKGEKGTFLFLGVGWSKEGKMYFNCMGGPAAHKAFRSFYPERVKCVLPPVDEDEGESFL
jgi:hypothetical protein